MLHNVHKDKDRHGYSLHIDTNTNQVNFTEHVLSNGLKVVLTPDNTIPSVAVNLCYHVGSKNESKNQRGYAHLFEHLMFEGSKNIAPGDYDRLSLQKGCENNAYTTEDKTNYYLLAPANELEFGLWLESDRMLEFSVTEESLRIQKGVVIEEKKQVFDNRPYGSVSIKLAPLLYKNNSYGWDTIGDVRDLKKATLNDIKEFYYRFYVPNNAVLTIAGDFDPAEALRLIKKYFGNIPEGKYSNNELRVGAEFIDQPLKGEVVKIVYDDVQLPGIFGAYKIPKENTDEFFAFDILTDILSTGESSRLYNELVYKKQLVSDVGCWVEGREYSSILQFYAILMPDVTIEEVQSEIDKIFDDAANGLVTQRELEKIKNRIETRHAYRVQTNLAKADMLSHYKTFYNDPGMINTNIERYNSITLDDMNRAADKYLKNAGRVILNYIPKPGSTVTENDSDLESDND
ncbi:MAG: insulinase family protein [Ignavibacteria bacterium]|nr:insulinase family protein [Ignavibacteria bacterium]